MSQGAAKRAARLSKSSEKMRGLVAARIETQREIGEINNWMSYASQLGNHKKYLNDRSKKVARLHALHDDVTNLNAAIKQLSIEESENRNQSIVMGFYNGVAALEERGVDVGEDLKKLLRRIEENE